MTSKIYVHVCDKSSIVRYGLEQLILANDDMLVSSSQCENFFFDNKHRSLPDILICDIVVESALIKLAEKFKQTKTKIIIYTDCFEDHLLAVYSALGIRGYLLKSSDCKDVIRAIRNIHTGGTHIDPIVAAKLISSRQKAREQQQFDLSKRELQVLALIANGKSNRYIAKKLFIGECTAKFHVGSILSKLGVKNRTEASFVAYQKGLIKDPQPTEHADEPAATIESQPTQPDLV